jgi:hypothetical protein
VARHWRLPQVDDDGGGGAYFASPRRGAWIASTGTFCVRPFLPRSPSPPPITHFSLPLHRSYFHACVSRMLDTLERPDAVLLPGRET